MIRTVFFCLSFALIFFINAQTYAPDQIIIEYEVGTSDTDKADIRAFYQTTTHTTIDEDIEVWGNVEFPLELDDEESSVIHSIEELLGYILNQGTGGQDRNARSKVQDGDLNYDLALNYDGLPSGGLPFDPLPLCPDDLNSKLIGPWTDNPPQDDSGYSIIVFDQVVTINSRTTHILDTETLQVLAPNSYEYRSYIHNIKSNSYIPTHGNFVSSIITNLMRQSGEHMHKYLNIPAFNNEGYSTSSELISVLSFFSRQDNNEANQFFRRNAILNFSAIVLPGEEDDFSILSNRLENIITRNNMLLITSAGNQGEYNANVFPASSRMENKIAVAGTSSCMDETWTFTNHNAQAFEIATSAEDIMALTHEEEEFLVHGTSFSAALVSGAAAQLATRMSTFSPSAIRQYLLDYADRESFLLGTCQEGRLLNITAAVEAFDRSGGNQGRRTLETGNPLASNAVANLQASPNPFYTQSQINISVDAHQTLNIELLNAQGQIITQQAWLAQPYAQSINWQTPTNLPNGMYFLRAHSGGAPVQQLSLVKM